MKRTETRSILNKAYVEVNDAHEAYINTALTYPEFYALAKTITQSQGKAYAEARQTLAQAHKNNPILEEAREVLEEALSRAYKAEAKLKDL